MGRRPGACEGFPGPTERGALSQLAWATLLCPAQVVQALLLRRRLSPLTLSPLHASLERFRLRDLHLSDILRPAG
eukprot:11060002-Alexandrium_andersonii.AAC.1